MDYQNITDNNLNILKKHYKNINNKMFILKLAQNNILGREIY